MEPSSHAPRAPHLIADAATLAAYVKDVAAGGHSWQAPNGQVTLEGWLALGDDCTEGAYTLATRLGLPLVRLQELPPSAEATALLRPEVVRRLRAVPLRLYEGVVTIAMEDPGSPDSLATLDFLCRQRVLPLVATAREVREGIAEHYDKVEDRDVAHQLGLDPGAAGHETSIQEAERLSREKPVVRIVQGLIGEAVMRRASDIHLRPGEHGTEVLYRIDDVMVRRERKITRLKTRHGIR